MAMAAETGRVDLYDQSSTGSLSDWTSGVAKGMRSFDCDSGFSLDLVCVALTEDGTPHAYAKGADGNYPGKTFPVALLKKGDINDVATGSYVQAAVAHIGTTAGWVIALRAVDGKITFVYCDSNMFRFRKLTPTLTSVADGSWRHVSLSGRVSQGTGVEVILTGMDGSLSWLSWGDGSDGDSFTNAWKDKTSTGGFKSAAKGSWGTADITFSEYQVRNGTPHGGAVWGTDPQGRLKAMAYDGSTWSTLDTSAVTDTIADLKPLSWNSDAAVYSAAWLINQKGQLLYTELAGLGAMGRVLEPYQYDLICKTGNSLNDKPCVTPTPPFKHVSSAPTSAGMNPTSWFRLHLTEGTPDPIGSYTLTFDSNGGSDVPAQTVASGKTPSKPADPTKNGFTFSGWYTDDDTFQHEFDFSKPLTADTVVHAKWVATADVNCMPTTGTPWSDWMWPALGVAVGLIGLAWGLAPGRRRV